MKRILRSKNISILIINLVPLFGTIFLGWDSKIIILFFIAETILMGFVHIIKMTALHFMNYRNPAALAIVRETQGLKGFALVPFFMVHYGFFIFVQTMLFLNFDHGPGFWASMAELFTGMYKWALVTIFLTKLSLLLAELTMDPNVHTKLPEDVFFEPYPRIIIQQFMVILGAWISVFSRNMMGYLIVLILLKTFFDIVVSNVSKETLGRWARRRERQTH